MTSAEATVLMRGAKTVGMQLKTTDGHGLAQIIRRKGDHLDYFCVHPKVSSNFILKRILRPVSHQCLSVFIRG
jgi:hypothetical protein